MLKLDRVSASYGAVPAISNVSIEIGAGEAVGLLGANGAGKSTTLRVISSLVKLTSGIITFAGTNLASLPPHKIPELGIAHVPEGRQVFPEMTVQENLEIGAYVPKAKAERSRTLDLVYGIFPRLADRKRQLAGTMSGGEQQMLAVGRGLMLKPRLLMLDEPSLGLAPVITDVTFERLARSTSWAPLSCWSSKTSAARSRWCSAPMCLKAAASSCTEQAPSSPATNKCRRRIWGFEEKRRCSEWSGRSPLDASASPKRRRRSNASGSSFRVCTWTRAT